MPGGAGQPDGGARRRHAGQRDDGGGAAQPPAAGPGGQAGQAQGRDGDPGQEHDPGDRQVRQPGVEDPGVLVWSKLPLELVGRISAQPLVSLNPVCDDITIARNPPNAATGAANRLGQ